VVYCTNQSPGPVVSLAGVVSTGFQNRVMFVTPGSFVWSVPASVSKMKELSLGLAVTPQRNGQGAAGVRRKKHLQLQGAHPST